MSKREDMKEMIVHGGTFEEDRTERKPCAYPVCDGDFPVFPCPTDIPADLTVTLAGEEWRADSPGVQCLPRASKEAEHPSSPSASLQRLSIAVSAPRVSDWNGRPEHKWEMG